MTAWIRSVMDLLLVPDACGVRRRARPSPAARRARRDARANLYRALEGRPGGMSTVLLSHDPDRFPQAVKRGVDLVLSGHPHGGQIAVPFFARHVNASKLPHHFHFGLYKDGNATLYVHPGLGTTGPPIRLGVAPAIVLLRLRSI